MVERTWGEIEMVTENIYVYVYKGLNMGLIEGKGKIIQKNSTASSFRGLCLIKIIFKDFFK